jgi:hypothetical protein
MNVAQAPQLIGLMFLYERPDDIFQTAFYDFVELV